MEIKLHLLPDHVSVLHFLICAFIHRETSKAAMGLRSVRTWSKSHKRDFKMWIQKHRRAKHLLITYFHQLGARARCQHERTNQFDLDRLPSCARQCWLAKRLCQSSSNLAGTAVMWCYAKGSSWQLRYEISSFDMDDCFQWGTFYSSDRTDSDILYQLCKNKTRNDIALLWWQQLQDIRLCSQICLLVRVSSAQQSNGS